METHRANFIMINYLLQVFCTFCSPEPLIQSDLSANRVSGRIGRSFLVEKKVKFTLGREGANDTLYAYSAHSTTRHGKKDETDRMVL